MDREFMLYMAMVFGIAVIFAALGTVTHFVDRAYPKPVPCKTCPECRK